VFAAFADPELNAKWFRGPDRWEPRTRTLAFREGGHETTPARCRVSGAAGFEATYHVIAPVAQIVYSYEMFHDEMRLSVSVTTIEPDPIDDGAATRLVFTEQGAYFEDGEAANMSREEGTIGLLKQLEESL
jgi:uncharacterized protein YndB with AHSA1/START domain